jgi:hypothetical protein
MVRRSARSISAVVRTSMPDPMTKSPVPEAFPVLYADPN